MRHPCHLASIMTDLSQYLDQRYDGYVKIDSYFLFEELGIAANGRQGEMIKSIIRDQFGKVPHSFDKKTFIYLVETFI